MVVEASLRSTSLTNAAMDQESDGIGAHISVPSSQALRIASQATLLQRLLCVWVWHLGLYIRILSCDLLQ